MAPPDMILSENRAGETYHSPYWCAGHWPNLWPSLGRSWQGRLARVPLNWQLSDNNLQQNRTLDMTGYGEQRCDFDRIDAHSLDSSIGQCADCLIGYLGLGWEWSWSILHLWPWHRWQLFAEASFLAAFCLLLGMQPPFVQWDKGFMMSVCLMCRCFSISRQNLLPRPHWGYGPCVPGPPSGRRWLWVLRKAPADHTI